VTSPSVRKILSCDLGHRYTPRDHFYLGSDFTDELQEMTGQLACDVFGSESADVTPLSGHEADMTLLTAFTRPGDKILTVSADDRGYPGICERGYPRILGLRTLRFPFERDRWNIQSDRGCGDHRQNSLGARHSTCREEESDRTSDKVPSCALRVKCLKFGLGAGDCRTAIG